MPDYVYMELRSTSTYKDIDIDAMMDSMSFDELMGGLYTSKIKSIVATDQPQVSKFDKMMS